MAQRCHPKQPRFTNAVIPRLSVQRYATKTLPGSTLRGDLASGTHWPFILSQWPSLRTHCHSKGEQKRKVTRCNRVRSAEQELSSERGGGGENTKAPMRTSQDTGLRDPGFPSLPQNLGGEKAHKNPKTSKHTHKNPTLDKKLGVKETEGEKVILSD